MSEMHEGRFYDQIERDCLFCGNPAVWYVRESSDREDSMTVCDHHKFTAFS